MMWRFAECFLPLTQSPYGLLPLAAKNMKWATHESRVRKGN